MRNSDRSDLDTPPKAEAPRQLVPRFQKAYFWVFLWSLAENFGIDTTPAGVAELVDAQDLGSCARKSVGVQVPPSALERRSQCLFDHWLLGFAPTLCH